MEDKKQWDFDDLLPHVGEFGRYQKLLVWLVCLPACIPCGFHAFNQLFMANVPDHWCKTPPDLEQQNWTLIERKMATIPYTVFNFTTRVSYLKNWFFPQQWQVNQGVMEFSKCTMFNVSEPTDGNNITDCLYGWEFDNLTVSSSIVIDVKYTLNVFFWVFFLKYFWFICFVCFFLVWIGLQSQSVPNHWSFIVKCGRHYWRLHLWRN